MEFFLDGEAEVLSPFTGFAVSIGAGYDDIAVAVDDCVREVFVG